MCRYATCGLQLCDHATDTSYGSVRCYNGYGQCKGAGSQASTGQTNWVNNCYPNDIWASMPAASPRYHNAGMNSGTLYFTNTCNGVQGCAATLAFSVRASFGFEYRPISFTLTNMLLWVFRPDGPTSYPTGMTLPVVLVPCTQLKPRRNINSFKIKTKVLIFSPWLRKFKMVLFGIIYFSIP